MLNATLVTYDKHVELHATAVPSIQHAGARCSAGTKSSPALFASSRAPCVPGAISSARAHTANTLYPAAPGGFPGTNARASVPTKWNEQLDIIVPREAAAEHRRCPKCLSSSKAALRLLRRLARLACRERSRALERTRPKTCGPGRISRNKRPRERSHETELPESTVQREAAVVPSDARSHLVSTEGGQAGRSVLRNTGTNNYDQICTTGT